MSHAEFPSLDVFLFDALREKQLIPQADSVVLKYGRDLGLLQFAHHGAGLQIDSFGLHPLLHLPDMESSLFFCKV